MKFPFSKKNEGSKKEMWTVMVPRDKWVKAAQLLHDQCGRDHLVVENTEDEEQLKVLVSFWSSREQCAIYLARLIQAGIEVVYEDEEEGEEPEEETKEVKKKK